MKVTTEFIDGNIALVTFQNGKLNVLSTSLFEGIFSAMREAERNDGVRVVVLQGYGEDAFSAGDDVKELRLLKEPTEVEDRLSRENDILDQIAQLRKPVIAVLRGYVLGGGLELALSCDMRIGQVSCALGFPEIKLGVFPGSGGMLRIGRVTNGSWARRLLFFGEPISAKEGLSAGLIDVVTEADPLEEGVSVARRLAKQSGEALRMIKTALRRLDEMPHGEGRELLLELSVAAFQTRAAREALAAFG